MINARNFCIVLYLSYQSKTVNIKKVDPYKQEFLH